MLLAKIDENRNGMARVICSGTKRFKVITSGRRIRIKTNIVIHTARRLWLMLSLYEDLSSFSLWFTVFVKWFGLINIGVNFELVAATAMSTI